MSSDSSNALDQGLMNQLARNRAGTQRNNGLTEKECKTQRHAYTEDIIAKSGYEVLSPTKVCHVEYMLTYLTCDDMRDIHVALYELGIKQPPSTDDDFDFDWDVVQDWLNKQRDIQQCIIRIVNARERSFAIEKAAMKAEMDAEMAKMKAEMEAEKAEMKAEMDKLKAENETFVTKDATEHANETVLLAKKKKKKNAAKKVADAKAAME